MEEEAELEEDLTLERFPKNGEPAPRRAGSLAEAPAVRQREPVRIVERSRSIPARHKAVRVIHRRSASELNEAILSNLAREYGTASEILDQAQSAYHFRNPQSAVSAEPYELLEGGYVDQALEALGLHAWTIGRPKS